MRKKTMEKLATCFGLGDLPKAPGTFGTLGGIPLFLFLYALKPIFPSESMYNSFYFLFLAVFFLFCVYVCDYSEREIYSEKDPQKVVIDEVLGYVTTLFLVNPKSLSELLVAVVLGFVFFRIFDIWKPGPVYKSQFIGAGVGVVADDFLAGVMANFLLVAVMNLIF